MPNLRRKNSQCEMVLHSPMPHIPPEILTYIFRLYLPSLDEQMSGSPGSPPSAQRPSCLAQVCRLWRAIVESDPHLWTSINFYFSSYGRTGCEEDERKMQAIFDLHFERSGTLPLSLTFTDHRRFSDSNKGLISLLANRLRGHSRRWKRISLHLTCNYFSLLFAFTPCDLSSLEHLHISGNGGDLCHSPRLCLDSATNLKSFANSGYYSYMINTVGLHWGRLAEVSFDFVSRHQSLPYQQFTHLVNCQNIITCSLGIDCIHSLHHLPQTITLPCLQTLRIRLLSNQADTLSLIDVLILPQLETLEIDSRFFVDKRYAPRQDRIFSNLLARSGCALRHLSIQDVDFSKEELMHCLTLSPTLTSLCFIPYSRSQNTTDLIRKLVVSPTTTVVGNQTQIQEHKQGGTDPLVPELRKLTLTTEREGSLDPIMAVLRSRGDACTRAAGVAALQRVEVIFFRKPRSANLHRPRAKLKKVEHFRSKLAQWASEVEMENAHNGIGGEVVAKVKIQSTTTAMARMAR